MDTGLWLRPAQYKCIAGLQNRLLMPVDLQKLILIKNGVNIHAGTYRNHHD